MQYKNSEHPVFSDLHATARAYAADGIPVFPCISNADGRALAPKERKKPACAGGYLAATTDVATVDTWWAENPEYNIGVCPETAGWAVVDQEAEGEGAWSKLQEEFGAVETYTVKTPGGGKHFYFKGSLPSRVRVSFHGEKLPLDTRGRGGYVLVPPSIVGDRPYEVLNDTDIAPVPAWVVENVGGNTDAHAAAPHTTDDPGNVARATALLRDYAGRGDIAVAGCGGDDRTYRIAAELLDLGVSPAKAAELILDHWNPYCQPPWSQEEVETKVANAASYRQNDAGAWAVQPGVEVFSGALDKLPKDPPAARSRFHPADDDEMDQTPAAQWTVPGLLQKATTAMIYGPTQSYKSFIALDLALAIACGVPTVGGQIPAVTGPVFYGALEGRSDIMRTRRPAWRMARGIEGKSQFYVMPAPMLVFPDETQEFQEQIAAKCGDGPKPALIVLDTVSKMMVGLDATHDAPKLIRFCDQLVERFGCTVLAIHHAGHDVGRGPRDSSAYRAGFDTVIEVTSPEKRICQVRVLKHKDAEEREQPWMLKGHSIGRSLVFQDTEYTPPVKSHKGSVTIGYQPADVGAGLRKLGALGPEDAVTTAVLAEELTPHLEAESAEERKAAVAATARRLGRDAKAALSAYCTRAAHGTAWYLPAPD